MVPFNLFDGALRADTTNMLYTTDLAKCLIKKDIRHLRHFKSRNTVFEHFIE